MKPSLLAVFLFTLGFSSPLLASVPAPYIPELSWEASKNSENPGIISETLLEETASYKTEPASLLAAAESYIEDEISEEALLGTQKKDSSQLSYLNATRYMMTCA